MTDLHVPPEELSTEATSEPILDLLKALADASRLKLLRLVQQHETAVGELATRLQLSEPTVSHHLAKLRAVGLVSLRMDGNYRLYRANAVGIGRFKRMVEQIEQLPVAAPVVISDETWIDALGWTEDELRVLRDHTVNGRIITIPGKQKKLMVLLRWIATLFEDGKHYTEREVNQIIKSVHLEDIAGLRRDLVDFGYLRRERGGGDYWLAPSSESDTDRSRLAE